jgi:hypothetical protein
MNEPFDLELTALIPWDDEVRGLPSQLEDEPQFGFVVPEQMRKVRAPVQVRLDAGGGFHLLGASGPLVHLDASGRAARRTPVAARGQLIDFACDAQGDCALLERLGGAGAPLQNRLRHLDPSGAERWSHTGPAEGETPDFTALRGTFSRVQLDDRGHLFLAAGTDVAEIDLATGKTGRVLHQRAGAGAPFLAAGRLHSVYFDGDANRRGVAVLDPASGESREWLGATNEFGWLVHPLGADNQSRLYLWRDGRLARLWPQGRLEELGAIDGVAVRPADRQVFSSHPVAGGVGVRGPHGTVVAAAPPDHHLVHVDDQGRYHLFGGEAPGHPGDVRIASPTGRIEATITPPKELLAIECRLSPLDAWQVDGAGRLVLPVVTPEGVALVRARFR